jgi:hypothetical protein
LENKSLPQQSAILFPTDIHAPRGTFAPTQCGSSATVLSRRTQGSALPPTYPAAWQNFFEQLWCYCNTLKTFTQRHTTGRIAWSHTI